MTISKKDRIASIFLLGAIAGAIIGTIMQTVFFIVLNPSPEETAKVLKEIPVLFAGKNHQ